MNSEQFKETHRDLLMAYGICFTENCDLWSMTNALNYYRESDSDEPSDEDYLFTMTGFGYNLQGELSFDFQGYIDLFSKSLEDPKYKLTKQ